MRSLPLEAGRRGSASDPATGRDRGRRPSRRAPPGRVAVRAPGDHERAAAAPRPSAASGSRKTASAQPLKARRATRRCRRRRAAPMATTATSAGSRSRTRPRAAQAAHDGRRQPGEDQPRATSRSPSTGSRGPVRRGTRAAPPARCTSALIKQEAVEELLERADHRRSRARSRRSAMAPPTAKADERRAAIAAAAQEQRCRHQRRDRADEEDAAARSASPARRRRRPAPTGGGRPPQGAGDMNSIIVVFSRGPPVA